MYENMKTWKFQTIGSYEIKVVNNFENICKQLTMQLVINLQNV